MLPGQTRIQHVGIRKSHVIEHDRSLLASGYGFRRRDGSRGYGLLRRAETGSVQLDHSPGLAGLAPGTTAGSAMTWALPATRAATLRPLKVKNAGEALCIRTFTTSLINWLGRSALTIIRTATSPRFVVAGA
jgi:hypothetical protein